MRTLSKLNYALEESLFRSLNDFEKSIFEPDLLRVINNVLWIDSIVRKRSYRFRNHLRERLL